MIKAIVEKRPDETKEHFLLHFSLYYTSGVKF
jgi:hypothetical protein